MQPETQRGNSSAGVEACRQSSASDGGHCYCWRNGSKFCCGCGSTLPHVVGDRLELVDPTPRIRGEVVAVSDGGYFTVKWDADPGKYKNYPPEKSSLFRSIGTNVRNASND